MSWIIVTGIAYFLTAVNSVIDKYLLNKSIPEPVTYAFYVGVFSIFTLALTPFGFHWPGIWQFIAAILTGTIFLLALISLYTALKADEASRVFAFVGGLSPVLIIIFSAILFDKVLLRHEYYAFLFLVAGSILISFRKSKECGIFELRKHQCVQSMEMALFASVFSPSTLFLPNIFLKIKNFSPASSGQNWNIRRCRLAPRRSRESQNNFCHQQKNDIWHRWPLHF